MPAHIRLPRDTYIPVGGCPKCGAFVRVKAEADSQVSRCKCGAEIVIEFTRDPLELFKGEETRK